MAPSTRSVLVFDSPRTCSQLFTKLFAAHPQLGHIFHPMIGASMYGPENLAQRFHNSDAATEAQERLSKASNLQDETYTVAVDRLIRQEAEIHETGKISWIKDHAYCVTNPDIVLTSIHNQPLPQTTNPTVLPDALFFSPLTRPIILIRHPAALIPSYYRAQSAVFQQSISDPSFAACSSLRWARIIFDAYLSRRNFPAEEEEKEAKPANDSRDRGLPLIIDAADLLQNPQIIVEQVCATLGIDTSGVQYVWRATPESEWPVDAIMRGFFRDLLQSEGVQIREEKRTAEEGEEEEVDARLEQDWIEEFGEEVARQMRGLVDGEVECYEYLRAHALRV